MRKALSLSSPSRKLAIFDRVLCFLIIPLFILFLGSLRLWAQELVWKEEGVIFSDPTIHNVEVTPLPDGRFRMYFHQGDQMKSAISTDARTFQIESGVRLTGSMPAIVKLPDGKWRMFYQVVENGKGIFKSALSSDGLTWAVEKGIRLSPGGEFDPDNIVHPTVIALPQGGYRMYYDGEVRRTEQEFTWRILSATSTDGLTWTKDPGVRINVNEGPLDADLVWSSHAEYYNLTNTYQLYFSAQTPADNLIDGIYSATSEDGLLFTVSGKPELTPTKESGESGTGGQKGSYQDPFVLELTEEKIMYYWINGSGIYSARLGEESPTPEPQSFWETLQQKPAELWEKIKNIGLPENFELYIIPTILLITGAGAVIYLWRSRLRR
ncbi:MAG TPA: hypothetical protein VI794_00730 [Patescibacteria group bacterium]|nr:hypothetical protein [Patescibacteria group bacterium]